LPQARALYLTFDDGPHPQNTPRLLDALSTAAARATFFVVGREAERHPKIVRRMVAEGHTIGDHTWSHSDIRKLAAREFLEELRRSREFLAELTGRPVQLFRPPYGFLGPRQLLTLLLQGYQVVLWNVDPKDCADGRAGADSRLAAWKMRFGDIVLLHDDMPHAPYLAQSVIGRAKVELPGVRFASL
jgi:peptidoglycan/xylan/chitin deacetylase (PgdA/CDA1 family)